jgi:hypothetical protein
VRLVSDAPFDPTQYVLAAIRAEDLPDTNFDADGWLTWPNVSAGIYALDLGRQSATRTEFMYSTTVILEPGKDWILELPAAGNGLLRVEVRRVGSGPRKVALDLPSKSGRDLYRVVELPSEGFVEFSCILPGEARASLVDAATGRTLAVGRASIAAGAPRTVIVLTEGSDFRRFRVVDGKGLPVAGATVGVQTSDGGSWIDGETTDDLGECSIPSLQPGEYLLDVRHPLRGYLLRHRVQLGGDRSKLVEIPFDPQLAVQVRFVDGTLPLPGVNAMLWSAEQEVFGLTHATSDNLGVATWTYFSPGSHLVKVSQVGYWPAQAKVPAGPLGSATDVQLRRVGNLTFELRNSDGLPVAGQAIEVQSLEYGLPVATWLAAKSVAAGPTGLTTDGKGRVELKGLPNGAYHWSTGGNGAPEGVLKVPPHGSFTQAVIAP